ncbi:MAG: prepilin-type N-terminal cleavage/methylation domain-containing protein [Desulfobulbaceae bacterium]|nr:prepilin-type N-terminal cleavage/methylation domain-containing protein [Desulfobulbaceae bacterium]
MTNTISDKNINWKIRCRQHAVNLRPEIKMSWFNKKSPAFTLIELVTVVFIIGVLAAIAIIGYTHYVEKAKVVTALNEINMLEKEIYAYGVENPTPLPPDLNAIGYGGFLDPWNRPYIYQPDLTIAPRTQAGTPINTDYDLYSEGKDGLSFPDINDPFSQDDMIRANDGAYKGYARRY